MGKNLGDVKFKNQTLKGSIMYGGLDPTGGIVVATGTTDNKVYVLDQKWYELWSYTMESAGSGPPIIFTINDKEFIGIVSTSELFNEFNNKGSSFYIFSLQ